MFLLVTGASTSPKPASPSPRPSPRPSQTAVRPSPSPATSPTTAVNVTGELAAALAVHNSHRSKHGVPALKWDAALQASAKTWAESCAMGMSRTPGVGELAAYGYSNFLAVVNDWYSGVSGVMGDGFLCGQNHPSCLHQ